MMMMMMSMFMLHHVLYVARLRRGDALPGLPEREPLSGRDGGEPLPVALHPPMVAVSRLARRVANDRAGVLTSYGFVESRLARLSYHRVPSEGKRGERL